MAYTLQAIIASSSIRDRIVAQNMYCVTLNAGALCMVPLPAAYLEKQQMPFLPLTDEGNTEIGDKLRELCCVLSSGTRIAYIEAEYWGGDGIQACVLFEGAQVIAPAMVSKDAINHALRWLGVQRKSDGDEFDAVGLGNHRDTDDWMSET